MDSTIGPADLTSNKKRAFSLANRQYSFLSDGDNGLFPPYIPDDPEKPHLVNAIKERERKNAIRGIIQELISHQRADWSPEAKDKQVSIWDSDQNASFKCWRKLALHVLYTCASKSVIKNYDMKREVIRHKVPILQPESTLRLPSYINAHFAKRQ